MGWAFLPPIQRQLSDPIRPVSGGFVPGAWTSPVFTGPMTHAVASAAPQGLIDGDGGGLGAPVQRSAPGPDLPLLPPPRPRAEGPLQRTARAQPEPSQPLPGEPARRPLTSASSQALPAVQRAAVTLPTADRVAAKPARTEPAPFEPALPKRALSGPALSDPALSDSALGASSPPAAGPLPFAQPEPASADDPVTDAGLIGEAVDNRPATHDGGPPAPTPSPSGPMPPLRVQRAASASATPARGDRPRLGIGPPLQRVPESAQGTPPDRARPAGRPDAPPVSPEGSDGDAAKARPGAGGFTEVPFGPVDRRSPLALPLQRTQAASGATSRAEESAAPPPPVDDANDPTVVPAPASAEPAVDVARPGAVDLPVLTPDLGAGPPSPASTLRDAPLHVGALRTSIQRSSVLPGPGAPQAGLAVRAAGLPTVAPQRVVRVQRVSASPDQAPATSPPPGAGTSPSSTPTGAPTIAATAPGLVTDGRRQVAPVTAGTGPQHAAALTGAAPGAAAGTGRAPTFLQRLTGRRPTSRPGPARPPESTAPRSDAPPLATTTHRDVAREDAADGAGPAATLDLPAGVHQPSAVGSGRPDRPPPVGPATRGSLEHREATRHGPTGRPAGPPHAAVQRSASLPTSAGPADGGAARAPTSPSGAAVVPEPPVAAPLAHLQRATAAGAGIAAPAAVPRGGPGLDGASLTRGGVAAAVGHAAPGPMPALVLPHRSPVTDAQEATSATVQRAPADGAAASSSSVTVQRNGRGGTTTSAPPEVPPSQPPVPARPPVSAAPVATAAELTSSEKEHLARSLFPVILRLMRRELVVDRDRRGLRSDRW